MKPNRTNPLLVSALAALLTAPAAFAAGLYWDSNGSTPGAGTSPGGIWGTDPFWSADATGASATANTPTTSVDDLFFSAGTDATGSYNIALASNQNAKSLTFEEGAVTLSGNTITLTTGGITVATGAGDAVIDSALTASGVRIYDVGAGRNLTLNGLVTSSITKNGSGTMTLGGAVDHVTGSFTVNQGVLITNRAAEGLNGAVTINSGGTLRWGDSNNHANGAAFTINAGGTLDVADRDDLIGTISGAGSITGSGATARVQVSGTSTFSGVISGNMRLRTNNASANLTLSSANTFTGTTELTLGSLTIANALALQNSALVTTGAGTLTLSGVTTPTFGGLSGATGNLATVITNYTSVTGLTLNPLSGSVTYGGVIANGTGNISLTKTGAGTQVFNGSTAHSFTGGLNLDGGTLTLDYANLDTDLINSANTLSFGKSSQLLITGKTGAFATSQTLGNVTVNSGGGSLLVNPNTGTSTTVNLGTLTTSASGGSLLVGKALSAGTGTLTITTTSNKDATGIYGGRVVFANGTANTGYNWGTTASGASPYTLSAYSGYSALNTATGTDTLNSRITANTTMAGSRTTNSLKFENPADAQTLDNSGDTLTLTSGGLLFTGASVATGPRIFGGSITAGNGSGSYDLVVSQFNVTAQGIVRGVTGTDLDKVTRIDSNIINNGGNAVTLVKAGTGDLYLKGTNTFTGGIVVNGGRIAFGASAMPSGAPITFNTSSTLLASGNTAGTITLNNASQVLVLANASSLTAGKVTGSGGLSVAQGGLGSVTLNLNNTGNDFTGPLRFEHTQANQSATINFASLADTDTPGTGNIVFGAAGSSNSAGHTLTRSASATTALTLNNRRIELANNQGNQAIENEDDTAFTINSDILASGAFGKTLTLGGSGSGLSAFAGVIQQNGANALSITKAESGTWVLSGRNTYTGATAVNAGVLNIQNGNALGTTAGSTTVASGAALAIQGNITVGAEALSLNGTGISNGGALRNISGTNIYGGLVTLAGATRINSDAGLLTLSNTGTITGPTFGLTVGGAGNTTIDSIIGTTTGTLTKGDAGTLTLTGANTYSGATTISGGTLRLSGSGRLGSGTYSGAVALDNSAIFDKSSTTTQIMSGNITGATGTVKLDNANGELLLRGSGNSYGTLSINAGRVFIQTNAGALPAAATVNLTGGTLDFDVAGTYAATINVSAGANIAARQATTLSNVDLPGSGTVIFNSDDAVTTTLAIGGNQTLTGTLTAQVGNVGGGGNATVGAVTLGGNIDGGGGLTKTQVGTLTLSGTNDYLGGTTVQRGTLSINGNQAGATGAVTVGGASAAGTPTLAGTGTIGGNVTIAAAGGGAAGTLAPGSGGIGNLLLNSTTLAFGTGSTASFEVDADTIANRDRVTGISALTYGGVLKITATGTLSAGDSWDLFDFTSQSGTFDNNGSFGTDGSSDANLPDLGAGLTWAFDYATGTLSVAGSSSAYDTWDDQITNGLNLRTDDADGDGFLNLQEFLFGTSPIAGNGSLVTTSSSGGNLVLRWLQRESGATYTLKQSATLGVGSWTPAAQTPAIDGVQTGAPTDYDYFTVSIPMGAGKLFFRIEGVEN